MRIEDAAHTINFAVDLHPLFVCLYPSAGIANPRTLLMWLMGAHVNRLSHAPKPSLGIILTGINGIN